MAGMSNINWKMSAAQIGDETDQLIEQTRKVYDEIGSLKQEDVCFENTIKVLGEHMAYHNTMESVLGFSQHVSPDKEVREASTLSDKKLSEFEVEMSMREDVFRNLCFLRENKKEPFEHTESQRYLERLIKLGKRNGLHLSQEIQEEIKKIKKRISDLGIDFGKNLNEENTVLEFTEEELVGLPFEFVESLDKSDNGERKVTLKYPHYFPCMRKASNPKTRQTLEKAFNSRCLEKNTAILEELVELRQKLKITPRSCLDYFKRGSTTDGFYTIYDFKSDDFITVYCDMTSEAGSAWTLVLSHTLKNKAMQQIGRKAFSEDQPLNENSPNWNLYRMSLSQMTYLKSQSTHWRVTCSFPSYKVDYTDYVRAKFAEFDIVTWLGRGICKKVEFVNIRGHQCAQCTSNWWQVQGVFFPHIDSSSNRGCQLDATQGSVHTENNFGYYIEAKNNAKFRCTANDLSTTNWWFGEYV